MNRYFGEVKKNFGFGCMRLPMRGGKVNNAEFSEMVDKFIEAGFNYFDTAHGYLSGESEIALKECLTSRYPRDKYILTDKLTGDYFRSEKDIRPFFFKQLEILGVDYLDFYLMHAQTEKLYEKFRKCRAYETAFELKREGKIRHVGLSFHDRAEVLDRILFDYPEIEVAQIQFNYADIDNAGIQSKKCYDVCRKHDKPIIVMEPVKGGTLVNLPENAAEIIEDLNVGSAASFAIRYCASFDGIFMVISGMSDINQMNDNISHMENFKPFEECEYEAVYEIKKILRSLDTIPCTACRYCTDGCPKKISIPDLFSCLNAKKQYKDWNSSYYYGVYTQSGGTASDCIGCGKCENSCPQHLRIRELLKDVAAVFDTEEKETGN